MGEQYALKLSETEMKTLIDRAKEWQADPEKLGEFINTKRLVHLQILMELAEKPPNSRSGPAIQMAAIRELSKIFVEVEKVLNLAKTYRERELSTVGPSGPGDTNGEGGPTGGPRRRRKARPDAAPEEDGVEVPDQ